MDSVIALDRRQRKRQAVHQNLLDAADWLFRDRGIAATTIDDIAEAADVARQTVFNHFPYKEALAVELSADEMLGVAQRALALLEAGMPALEVLQQTAELVLQTAIREGELAVVVARELLHPDPERAARAERQLPLCEIFEALLMQAREEGAIRGDLPVRVMAGRFCALFRSILLQVRTHSPEELQSELAICFEMMFNGITDRS